MSPRRALCRPPPLPRQFNLASPHNTSPGAQLRYSRGEPVWPLKIPILNHGLFVAPRGLIALSTVMDEQLIDEVVEKASAAMNDTASELARA